ncbi:MAG: hypothetical protein IT343_23135 [Candidatus Melainabacteria bacterium]|jgi:hypothetical protein|nr:hypothetical protein [Candidatus Melainabacteria bacterium]
MMIVRHSYISVNAKQRGGVSLKAARGLAIGTALGHVKYIQHRPGKDLEKGGRDVFTDAEDSVDAKELRDIIREYEGRGVVVHKLTLSPEVSPNDPKEFTREVMEQLGSEKGLDLQWWAVTHDNTDNRHVHVVVLPKDKEGRFVRFDKNDYNRLKEFGDRYLERTQYSDCRMAELVRQEKHRQRSDERRQLLEKERQERIRNGEELPWLHKKIVREQLEPYQQWNKDQPRDPKDSFEYLGQRFSKDDGYERLAGLRRHLHDNNDKSLRLPKEDYKRLARWIEQKDRARFSGEIDRQLSSAKASQTARDEARNSPAANRYVSPLQQEMMRNPIMGLFLTEAAIAAELVRWIPLTDQRDRLKENRDDLEDAKRDVEAKQRTRGNPDQKAADEEIIEKIDDAIDDNKNTRKDARKEREIEERKRDRDLDFME